MNAEIKTITPDLARELLKSNRSNRTVRQSTVDRYAELMKSGQWHFNGESISFDENGIVVNGQHRLMACIKANIPFQAVIVNGVKAEDSFLYDAGVNRTKKATIEIAQKRGIIEDDPVIRSNSMLAIAGYIMSIKIAREKTGNKDALEEMYAQYVSAEMCANYIIQHRNGFQFLYEHQTSCKSRLRKATVWAAILQAYESGYNYDRLARFCEVLNTGITQGAEDISAIRLRDRLFTIISGNQGVRKSLYLITQYSLKQFELGKCNARMRESAKEFYTGAYDSKEANNEHS